MVMCTKCALSWSLALPVQDCLISGARLQPLSDVPSYTPAMSTLEERMEDFAPSVIVKRDGVEVEIPMAEFMADAEESEPDETAAQSHGL
jgi:hypothetical protein